MSGFDLNYLHIDLIFTWEELSAFRISKRLWGGYGQHSFMTGESANKIAEVVYFLEECGNDNNFGFFCLLIVFILFLECIVEFVEDLLVAE